MERTLRALAAAGVLFAAVWAATRWRRNRGAYSKVYFFDSPASRSFQEEATIAGRGPTMGVFNNLVMYKQDASGISSLAPIARRLFR
jgi:hypothetical protein